MPTGYARPTFCGATVRNIQSALGWGGQRSSVNVSVVEDLTNGDLFVPPLPGQPIWLQVPECPYKFFGMMQSYRKDNAVEGWPTYTISAVDPTDILDGVIVILDSYSAATSIMPNLINVYGYWENLLGFGGAEVNESGMPWNKILTALHDITNTVAGTVFGGPLQYKGYSYALDLSELPVTPAYYRIGGTYSSLLTLIQQVCDDGSADFFITLLNTLPLPTIKVRTVSRRTAPVIGAISALIDTYTSAGTCIRSSYGLEDRNEATSHFCIGGPIHEMYTADATALTPYWGDDHLGNPIVGVGTGFAHTMNLYIPEIADITGDLYYSCSVAELCTIISSGGISGWLTYLWNNRPLLAELIGASPDSVVPDAEIFHANDLRPTNAFGLHREADYFEEDQDPCDKVYQALRRYAEEYMGRQFLVRIPFTLSKLVSETDEIVFSHEGADAAYPVDGLPPLGMDFLTEAKFINDQGLYHGVARFDDISLLDHRNWSGAQENFSLLLNATTGKYMAYIKIEVDTKPVFVDPITPCLKVSFADQIFERQVNEATGMDPDVVAEVFHNNNALDIEKLRNMPVNGELAPVHYLRSPPRQPDFISVPLKSNILCYGPWYSVGATGKVHFDQDTSLVPWNYGGFDLLNLAALSKVSEALSEVQYIESGEITFVGLPSHNLGDILQVNGAAMTDIDITYGVDRISTSYRMKTYTPRFGVFSKDADTRIQRLVRTTQSLRQQFRQALVEGSKFEFNLSRAYNRLLRPLQAQKAAVRQETPYGILVSAVNTGSTNRPSCQLFNLNEARSALRANDPDVYNQQSAMSLDGFFRPIDGRFADTGTILPSFSSPHPAFASSVTSEYLNPFRAGNDIAFILRGQAPVPTGSNLGVADPEYDFNNYRYTTLPTGGTRPLALRGPLVVCGWGYDLKNNLVPDPDPYRKCATWKVGSVDLLWDQYRKVWTSHDMIMGKLPEELPPTGSIQMEIYAGETPTGEFITVNNYFNSAVASGSRVFASYFMHANAWYITAADCP